MEDWGAVRDRLADQARDLERRALRERSSAASLVNDHEGAEGAGEEATLYDQLADKLSREAADIRAALDRESDQAQELAEIRLALRKADARDLPLTNVQMIAALCQRVEEFEREIERLKALGLERQEWRSRMGLSTQDVIVQRAEAAEATLTKLRNEGYRIVELEARLARCVEALEGLLEAWDRAEGGGGCYSCAELHDCRCELARKISTVCTCGRVELDAAAEVARVACAAAKEEEENARLRQRVEELEREKYGTPCKCEQWIEACRTECEQWIEACRTAEAKLARCVEALNYGLLLTASWSDVRTHNWRNGARAALAAAKGE